MQTCAFGERNSWGSESSFVAQALSSGQRLSNRAVFQTLQGPKARDKELLASGRKQSAAKTNGEAAPREGKAGDETNGKPDKKEKQKAETPESEKAEKSEKVEAEKKVEKAGTKLNGPRHSFLAGHSRQQASALTGIPGSVAVGF